MSRPARTIGTALVVMALVASVAAAQFGRQRGRRGFGFRRPSYHFATLDDFTSGFQFCRLVADESPYGDGAGWNVDYPRADLNLSIRLSELTRADVSMDSTGEPKPLLVTLKQPDILAHCPLVMMTEPGAAVFSTEEASALHDYLMRGGFLWADDYWGQYAWDFFDRQLRQALPASEYPVVDLPREHPIFHEVYDASNVPQIPGIGYWDGYRKTWERSPQEATPHIRGIFDERGRLLVLLTHDTDFGDAYEREAENPDYFVNFSAPGYSFGIDAIVYAMTH